MTITKSSKVATLLSRALRAGGRCNSRMQAIHSHRMSIEFPLKFSYLEFEDSGHHGGELSLPVSLIAPESKRYAMRFDNNDISVMNMTKSPSCGLSFGIGSLCIGPVPRVKRRLGLTSHAPLGLATETHPQRSQALQSYRPALVAGKQPSKDPNHRCRP